MTQEKKFILKYLWNTRDSGKDLFEIIIGDGFEVDGKKLFDPNLLKTDHPNLWEKELSFKWGSGQNLASFEFRKRSISEELGMVFTPFRSHPSARKLNEGHFYQFVHTGELVIEHPDIIVGVENGEIKEFRDLTKFFSARKFFIEEMKGTKTKIVSLENDANFWKNKVKNLEAERNEWRIKFNNKNREYEEYKEKYEGKNEELQTERLSHANLIAGERLKHSRDNSALQIELTQVKEQRDNFSSQVTDLTRRLTDSDNKVTRLGTSLTEKNREIQVIAGQLANLQIERENQNNQLQNTQRELTRVQAERDERIAATDLQELLFGIENREREITSLRERLGQSRESDLTEKIRHKEQRLESFTHNLGIDWEQIQLLQDICKELVRSRHNGDTDGIRTSQSVVETIKQNLLQTQVRLNDVQEICEKCEEIAQLSLQLEQQFEARVEITTHF